MPYKLSTTTRDGKKKYCMTNINTNKKYCYNSAKARKNGMKMHHAFGKSKK